jgi:hypothetical protein
MTPRRKSRRFSRRRHVRLSGEDPQLFGDNPFAHHILLPETHIKAKINALDVKGDKTP